MNKLILILIMIYGFSIAYSNPLPDEIILYKKTQSTDLKLHVFNPKINIQKKRPAIIFFFGGGWNNGSPEQFYKQARYFSNLGIVSFSAEYRVKSRDDVKPDSCIMDAKSAIRFLRENASVWNIDENKIIASGGSAGGHLAAATATLKKFNDEQDNLNYSSVPNALVLFNPVLDTYLGTKRLGELAKQISPLQNIGSKMPPTLILHGTADTVVPHNQAIDFKNTMIEKGHNCEVELYEEMPHGFFNQKKYDETIKRASEFIDKLGWINK